MNMSVNKNINFKGGVITPAMQNDFVSVIFRTQNKSQGARTSWVGSDDLIKSDLVNGKRLTLWGNDVFLFQKFLEDNNNKIPPVEILPLSAKSSKLTKAIKYIIDRVVPKYGSDNKVIPATCIKAANLTKALTYFVEFPEVKTQEDVDNFVRNPQLLSQELLTPEILEKALERIKTKKN